MISFCINTSRNELNHVKLLFRSLQTNLSRLDYEILLFIDSDNQGTLEWAISQKKIFPGLKILHNHLPICYGYARNINEMFKVASSDIVSYLQSDMVVCKNYDLEVLKHISPNTIICSTRMEPPLHGPGDEKYTHDLGTDPVTFELDRFTGIAEQIKSDKITEFFFAPFTLYKEVWNSIGGHDTSFRRSREDSDMLARLVLNGTKIIQVWNALVYHFTCTSSRGINWWAPNAETSQLQEIADKIEMKKYIKKWGYFQHNTLPHYRYATTLVIDNNTSISQELNDIALWFDSIICNTPSWRDDINIHKAANHLLKISDEDWTKYLYMYNQIDLQSHTVPPLIAMTNGTVITIPADELTTDFIYSHISMIQHLIHTYEIGTYKFGVNGIMTIFDKTDFAKSLIQVNNPEIKPEHLYKIY